MLLQQAQALWRIVTRYEKMARNFPRHHHCRSHRFVAPMNINKT
jgi:hypothetical protein